MKLKFLTNLFKAGKTLTTNSVSGMIKPLPLSGIVNEIGNAVGEIKQQNNYTRLIKVGAYLLMGSALYYVIARGLMTFDQVKELVEMVTESMKEATE